MSRKPLFVSENITATKALSIMSKNKVTSLCVYDKNKKKTIGIIHIHNILQSNIS